MSCINFAEDPSRPIPLMLQIANHWVMFLGVSFNRLLIMFGGKSFDIKLNDNYYNFVTRVLNRPKGIPLITLSNHRSVLDDPPILSCVLPYFYNIQPKYVRWSICAQEFCFNDKASSFVHAFFLCGKGMPILRGAGIDQMLLLDFAKRIAIGDWCHIFPEGGGNNHSINDNLTSHIPYSPH